MITPRATYRFQLGPGFSLHAAAAAVRYLAQLGISHVYLSPVLQGAGSAGGYDVVDPGRVATELGGEAGLTALVEAAREAGLGIMLDVVPNHMSIAGHENAWWLDVLENGPSSAYSHYFDVDWSTPRVTIASSSEGETGDRILLPILTERYGVALTRGMLGVLHDGKGGVTIRAGDQRLPIAPRTLGWIVQRAGSRAADDELIVIGDALAALPAPSTRDDAERSRRHLHKMVMTRRLAELCVTQPSCARALDAEIAEINSDPAEIDDLLEGQNYRLAHWSVAGSELGYRRFFDVHTLVGLRIEDPAVFAASHQRILGWLADGTIEGLRVDHVDGLRDPEGYLRRLRDHAGDAWIVVEKILAAGETLPATWPVDGTVGYEWMELVGGLWIDPEGEATLTAAFEAATGERFAPGLARRKARHEVMQDGLHSELARLTEIAARACATIPACRDYTRREIEAALAEIFAGYPTYRTYIREGIPAPPADRARIAAAVAAAAITRHELDRDLLAFLDAALAHELANPEALRLGQAAQQLTGAIMAKGIEDTVLYRQVRLLARCEVGADLERFGIEPAEVHRGLAATPPRSLLATSTHDTKRSEDVRARLAVLSELPQAWTDAVTRWSARASRHWGDVAPDRTGEYILWQTLVGAWALPVERTRNFMIKATREAGQRTAWRRRDEGYEAALIKLVDGVYADGELLVEIASFAATLRTHGDRNSLAQLLIKLTAPGVPDIYQGSELRDDSLVDPDNRRPIDLADRRHKLAWSANASVSDVVSAGDLGCAKLWTIRQVLDLRRREPSLFTGSYRAVAATGTHATRVFAFARGDRLLTIVPRLGAGANGWPETQLELPTGRWRNPMTTDEHEGGPIDVARLWTKFPIALLVRTS